MARERAARHWVGQAVAEVLDLDGGDWANRTREQKAARARAKTMLGDWVRSGALKRELRYVGHLGREVPFIAPGEPVTAGGLRTPRGVVRQITRAARKPWRYINL